MVIEIGERIAPEKGDYGDIGYPGIYGPARHAILAFFKIKRLKFNFHILGLQGEDGALGGIGLPGSPGAAGENGETGSDGIPVRNIYTDLFSFVI